MSLVTIPARLAVVPSRNHGTAVYCAANPESDCRWSRQRLTSPAEVDAAVRAGQQHLAHHHDAGGPL